MLLLLLIVIAVPLVLALAYTIYERLSNSNFAKTAPPVSTGWIPWLGDVRVFEPGLREYLESQRSKHGDIFTVFVRGQYWTFVFGEQYLKTYFTAAEKTISSFEFLHQMLEPMQPVSVETMRNLSTSLHSVTLLHKILNITEQLQRMATTVETVAQDMIHQEWFAKGKTEYTTNVFDALYKMTFFANTLNFAGQEMYDQYRHDMFELFQIIDYSRVDPLQEIIKKKLLHVKTASQKAYSRMEQIVGVICKQRDGKDGEYNDIMNFLISHVKSKKLQGEIEQFSETEAVSILLLNMYIASQITSSNTFGWMIINVLHSKDERLIPAILKEVDAAPQPITLDYLATQMPVCDAVVTESVRFGLLGIGGRLLMEPVVFGKYTVPKGNIMYHPYYGTAQHFTDSNKFDPFRYLEREEHKEKNFLFAPFGAGRHPCAGKTLANNTLKTFLIALFRNCNMKLLNEPKYAPTCLANFNRQVPESKIEIAYSHDSSSF